MSANLSFPARRQRRRGQPELPPFFLSPLQPLLQRIVGNVSRNLPELFDRLGPHRYSRFLIDARDLPFVLLLRPDPARPCLRAYPRSAAPDSDARISGLCRDLVTMIDGGMDGDALFFSRDLHITGNLEAVVCLRNALDDVDGSIMDHVAAALGKPGRVAWSWLRARERHRQRANPAA